MCQWSVFRAVFAGAVGIPMRQRSVIPCASGRYCLRAESVFLARAVGIVAPPPVEVRCSATPVLQNLRRRSVLRSLKLLDPRITCANGRYSRLWLLDFCHNPLRYLSVCQHGRLVASSTAETVRNLRERSVFTAVLCVRGRYSRPFCARGRYSLCERSV